MAVTSLAEQHVQLCFSGKEPGFLILEWVSFWSYENQGETRGPLNAYYTLAHLQSGAVKLVLRRH